MTEDPAGKPGETPEQPTNPTSAPPTGDETPPWGNDFDPARAWATIQNLRKVEGDYKTLRKQVDDADAAAKQAEELALAEKQEFKTLADKRQSELDALKPQAEKATRYETALKKLLDTERSGLPAYILPLLDRMEPDEQLAYIAEHRETLRPASKDGIPGTPGGNRQPETAEDIKNRYLKQAGALQ